MYPEQYLTDIFTWILNMSITGSYIILAVIIARMLLKKAPKKLSYLLWIAPFVRLVFPFVPNSPFSIFSLGIFNKDVYSGTIHEYVPMSYDSDYNPEFATGISRNQNVIPSTFNALATSPENSVNPLQVILFIFSALWISGILLFLVYACVTLIKTKKRLSTAVKLEGNVYESENIDSPFVMGIIRPKIYLPYGLSDSEKEYIILHEKVHIKNLDHFSKIFAFFVLALHWFNPLCYLAFILMSRDMEMACDEAVLKNNESIRKTYSSSLLSFATNKKLPSPSPLCFGESGVKQRIRNILTLKKPKAWLIAAGLTVVFICTVAFISNPAGSTVFSGKINAELDKAISQMILDQNYSGLPYFCKTEGHKIFGYSEKENEITVYGYMSYRTMNFMNGYLSDYHGSGGSNPFVAVFIKDNGKYILKECKDPGMGSAYGSNIKEMFPAEFEKQALYPKSYKDELQKQHSAQAYDALREAGIDCEFVPSSDVDIIMTLDYETQEKIDNLDEYNSWIYPSFIGVTMYKQGNQYIVYERRADNEKGRFYLASYPNGSSETVAKAFDNNGNYIGQETIPVKDFFLYEAPNQDSTLYYAYKTDNFTTSVYVIDEVSSDANPPEPTTLNGENF